MSESRLLEGPSFDPAIGKRVRTDRQLTESLLELGQRKAQVLMHMQKAWASITFSGARHSFDMMFTGEEAVEAGEAFIALLPDHEFTIPGQLVADAAVTAASHDAVAGTLLVSCELLLLEES